MPGFSGWGKCSIACIQGPPKGGERDRNGRERAPEQELGHRSHVQLYSVSKRLATGVRPAKAGGGDHE